MSKLNIVTLAVLALALSGCSPAKDDPENIPKLGDWNSKVELESLTMGGFTFNGDIPAELEAVLGKRVQYTEMGCTEPRVKMVADLNDKMPPNIAAMCKLIETKTATGNPSFASICDNKKMPKGIVDMSFTGEPDVRDDAIKLTFRVAVVAGEGDGENVTLNLVQTRSYWRTGDCKA
jgi:hypothetical protein